MTKHPLINKDSSHYDQGEKPAILELEEQLTIQEMIGFCKANIFKYNYRKEHKGQKESDDKKIETYENYLALLTEMKDKIGSSLTVAIGYNVLDINLDYT